METVQLSRAEAVAPLEFSKDEEKQFPPQASDTDVQLAALKQLNERRSKSKEPSYLRRTYREIEKLSRSERETFYHLGFRKNSERSYRFLFQHPATWMKSGVKHELAPWKNKHLTQSKVEEVFRQLNKKHEAPFALFSIKNGKVEAKLPDGKELNASQKLRYTTMLSYLPELLKVQSLPNLSFILLLEDGYTEQEIITPSVPVFSFTKPVNNKKFILIPDTHSLRRLNKPGYKSYNWKKDFYQVQHYSKKYTWKKLSPQLFWRGRLSDNVGQDYSITNFSKFPRGKLLLLSKLNPDSINAKATSAASEELIKHLQGLGMAEDKFIDKAQQLRYKYQLVLDGVTCTYPGLHWRLLSNSLVLKQESPHVQWFYRAIYPNVHYVQVKKDLSDLDMTITKLKANEGLSKKIAATGAKFARENLDFESIAQYLHLSLESYSKLFK